MRPNARQDRWRALASQLPRAAVGAFVSFAVPLGPTSCAPHKTPQASSAEPAPSVREESIGFGKVEIELHDEPGLLTVSVTPQCRIVEVERASGSGGAELEGVEPDGTVQPCSSYVAESAIVRLRGAGQILDLGLAQTRLPLVVNLIQVTPTNWSKGADRPKSFQVEVNEQVVGQVTAAPIHEHREKASWEKLDRKACETPTSPDACDGVITYLREYPDSALRADVEALLSTVASPLDVLRDDSEWLSVDVPGCRAAGTDDACDTVDAYLARRPNGRHAGAAKAARAAAEPKLAKLRRDLLIQERKREQEQEEERERLRERERERLHRSAAIDAARHLRVEELCPVHLDMLVADCMDCCNLYGPTTAYSLMSSAEYRICLQICGVVLP